MDLVKTVASFWIAGLSRVRLINLGLEVNRFAMDSFCLTGIKILRGGCDRV